MRSLADYLDDGEAFLGELPFDVANVRVEFRCVQAASTAVRCHCPVDFLATRVDGRRIVGPCKWRRSAQLWYRKCMCSTPDDFG